ncbi:MAG: hypothetical protein ACYCW6_08165 [Candidatus Xenobia bacterium]
MDDDYTPGEEAQIRALTQGYGDQSASGVDLSLLRANLRLTPLERLRKLQANARFLERLKNAARSRKTD